MESVSYTNANNMIKIKKVLDEHAKLIDQLNIKILNNKKEIESLNRMYVESQDNLNNIIMNFIK
jgi:uncharacterized coiled-coil DUF342 family protein